VRESTSKKIEKSFNALRHLQLLSSKLNGEAKKKNNPRWKYAGLGVKCTFDEPAASLSKERKIVKDYDSIWVSGFFFGIE
jgi:hypothetical protein